MVARSKRTKEWQEARAAVRQARQLAEKWGLDHAHPDDYIEMPNRPDFDDLLSRMK